MHILLVNDDGIQAPGLHALAEVLGRKHRLTVSAPSEERSAVGHGITVRQPLFVESRQVPGAQAAYAVSGTPADCARLGLISLVQEPVDVVISGINKGLNVAMDMLYSGTVSAAMEAAMLDRKSIAVSTQWDGDFTRAAEIFARLLDQLDVEKDIDFMLNVNIPALPGQELKGVKWVPAGRTHLWADTYEHRRTPDGRDYYWLKNLQDAATPDYGVDTDIGCVANGYVALSPLVYDLTDREGFRNKTFDLQENS